MAHPVAGHSGHRHQRASVDGQQVDSLTDSTLTRGIPGIEVGGWYPAYFSNLTVTNP